VFGSRPTFQQWMLITVPLLRKTPLAVPLETLPAVYEAAHNMLNSYFAQPEDPTKASPFWAQFCAGEIFRMEHGSLEQVAAWAYLKTMRLLPDEEARGLSRAVSDILLESYIVRGVV